MNPFFALILSLSLAAGTLGYLSGTDTEEARVLHDIAAIPTTVVGDFATAAERAAADLFPRLSDVDRVTGQVAQTSGASIVDTATQWLRSLFAPKTETTITETAVERTLSDIRPDVQQPTTTPVRGGTTTVINQPVIERTIERIITTESTSGITEARLQQGLAALKQELLGLIPQHHSAPTFALPAFAASQSIDQLTGTSLNNITVNGVSGLTDADIPDTITASNYMPLSGGTISGAAYLGIGSGNVGVGTTSPYAKLSIHGTANETNTTLFAVASSTGGATTTLFTIDNFGRVGSNIGDASGSVMFGTGAGVGQYPTTTSAIGNTVFGYEAFATATSSHYITAIGYRALASNISGELDSYDIEGDANTAVGYEALTLNAIGHSNTAVGTGALRNNTTGDFNTAFGTYALFWNETGQGNVGIGLYALLNTTGDNNTAVGREAAFHNTTGGDNVAMSIWALFENRTGNNNVALGRQALQESRTGSNNIALGRQSSENNLSATNTVAIGSHAAIGSGGDYWAQGYTMLGFETGRNITTGADYNTFIGYQSGEGVTTGYGNTLLGSSVTTGNLTTGSGNIGIGYNTFFPSATANNQLNIGGLLFGTLPATSTSFRLPTTGAFGVASSSPWATLSVHANNGSTNTALFAVGSSTASATTTHFVVTNSGNVIVGGTRVIWDEKLSSASSADTAQIGAYSSSASYTNKLIRLQTETAAGTGWQLINGRSAGGAEQFIVYGNGNVVNTNNSYGAISDERLKKDILDVPSYLDALNDVRVVSYLLKTDTAGTAPHLGVIAQELQPIFPDLVATSTWNEGEYLQVNYSQFTPILIKAVQDLYGKFIELRDTVLAFADRFVSNEITATNRFCIGSTCINENDLQQLLELRNGQTASAANSQQLTADSNSETEEEQETPDTEAPVITINGNNPARVELGTSYNDLGALITDNRDVNIALRIKLNGESVERVSIDTTTAATYAITYTATDQAGNTGTATRTVEVYDPNEDKDVTEEPVEEVIDEEQQEETIETEAEPEE